MTETERAAIKQVTTESLITELLDRSDTGIIVLDRPEDFGQQTKWWWKKGNHHHCRSLAKYIDSLLEGEIIKECLDDKGDGANV